MDNPTIITMTILAVVVLLILVLAGLVLSARSYTQLLETIRSIGSLVVQQHQATQQRLTSSLTEMEHAIKSSPPEDGDTTPGPHV